MVSEEERERLWSLIEAYAKELLTAATSTLMDHWQAENAASLIRAELRSALGFDDSPDTVQSAL